MKKKGLEYSFIKLMLILFVVLLLMAALYRFYWQPAKRTITPITTDIEEQWQKETEEMEEITSGIVEENRADES